ncbi:hypothetical protein LINPERPRIM_LOCUS14864 [Linum perenne]
MTMKLFITIHLR